MLLWEHRGRYRSQRIWVSGFGKVQVPLPFFLPFFKKRFYLLSSERGKGREKEKARNIDVTEMYAPPLGSEPTIQTCTLTRNWTRTFHLAGWRPTIWATGVGHLFPKCTSYGGLHVLGKGVSFKEDNQLLCQGGWGHEWWFCPLCHLVFLYFSLLFKILFFASKVIDRVGNVKSYSLRSWWLGKASVWGLLEERSGENKVPALKCFL